MSENGLFALLQLFINGYAFVAHTKESGPLQKVWRELPFSN